MYIRIFWRALFMHPIQNFWMICVDGWRANINHINTRFVISLYSSFLSFSFSFSVLIIVVAVLASFLLLFTVATIPNPNVLELCVSVCVCFCICQSFLHTIHTLDSLVEQSHICTWRCLTERALVMVAYSTRYVCRDNFKFSVSSSDVYRTQQMKRL